MSSSWAEDQALKRIRIETAGGGGSTFGRDSSTGALTGTSTLSGVRAGSGGFGGPDFGNSARTLTPVGLKVDLTSRSTRSNSVRNPPPQVPSSRSFSQPPYLVR